MSSRNSGHRDGIYDANYIYLDVTLCFIFAFLSRHCCNVTALHPTFLFRGPKCTIISRLCAIIREFIVKRRYINMLMIPNADHDAWVVLYCVTFQISQWNLWRPSQPKRSNYNRLSNCFELELLELLLSMFERTSIFLLFPLLWIPAHYVTFLYALYITFQPHTKFLFLFFMAVDSTDKFPYVRRSAAMKLFSKSGKSYAKLTTPNESVLDDKLPILYRWHI